jgi:uncharacterized membrane protein YccC
VTAVRTARSWLTGHDPGLVALRKAMRVTVAACVGFFFCEYLVGLPTLATYAVFGTIAFGFLSDVGGPPAQRTRTYLAAWPVALLLVSIGTATARSTTAAVIGMLVVGFAVAYAGVGGPRFTGVANGLQLFYVLPCFPPYDPDSLPQRLIGLTIGIALITTADRLLWPAGAPVPFRMRLADAADAVGRYIAALPSDDPREAAEAAVTGLRSSGLPPAVRPTGPGRRDRGFTHATAELRTMVVRAHLLAGLLPDLRDPVARAAADSVLALVGDVLARSAAALRGTGPPPESGPLVTGVADYLEGRAERIAGRLTGDEVPPVLRIGGLTAAIGEAARGLVAAVRAGTGAPPDPTAEPPASAWYLGLATAELWWRRFSAHFTPRSVYFQNAVRLALGLAAARLLADVLDLSHGFWVLLATLSLMRTSLVASGLALIPAFLGTLGGAVVAAGVLTLVGDDTIVYAVVLPIAMLLTFAAGPLLGPAPAQFGFTIVVSVLFAQLAPATWKVAEVRLTDVVVGGLVGALIGAAVWPRGGAGEVRRAAAACLRFTADELVATVRALTGTPSREPAQHRLRPDPSHRVTVLFDITYAQFRSEPAHTHPAHDWLEVLTVVQRAASDVEVLRDRYPAPDPLPWPAVSRRLVAGAEDVALAFRDAAGAVQAGDDDPPNRHLAERLDADPPHAHFADDVHATLRVIDAWGWMHGLSSDLIRAERAARAR